MLLVVVWGCEWDEVLGPLVAGEVALAEWIGLGGAVIVECGPEEVGGEVFA